MVIIVIAILLFLLFLNGKRLEKERRQELNKRFSDDFGVNKNASNCQHKDVYLKYHDEANFVDEITWKDCELENVYNRINTCQSDVGQEYLYARLHNTNQSEEELEKLDLICDKFSEDEAVRLKAQNYLYELGKSRHSLFEMLYNISNADIHELKGIMLRDSLLIFAIICCIIKPLQGFICLLAVIIYNVYRYFIIKNKLSVYTEGLGYLSKTIVCAKQLSQLDIRSVLDNDLSNLFSDNKELSKFSFLSKVLITDTSLGANPILLLFSYLNMILHLDILLTQIYIKQIAKKSVIAENIALYVGFIDTAIAVASFRKSLKNGYCKPNFSEEYTIRIIDGYLPLVDEPVMNSLDYEEGILITGSNASGKSTYLRMIGVAAVLAQTIYTVCSREYRSRRVQIMSSIALSDNVIKNESYFMAEIRSLKRIIDAGNSDKFVLALVDEIFRGTNTKERISASCAVLEAVVNKSIFMIAASHDIELTRLLENMYSNYHFEESFDGKDMYFSYKLIEGSSNSHNAIDLLSVNGFEPEIVDKAKRILEKFTEN